MNSEIEKTLEDCLNTLESTKYYFVNLNKERPFNLDSLMIRVNISIYKIKCLQQLERLREESKP